MNLHLNIMIFITMNITGDLDVNINMQNIHNYKPNAYLCTAKNQRKTYEKQRLFAIY